MKIGSPKRKCRRVKRTCLNCGEVFLADVSEIKRGKAKYCSRHCLSQVGRQARGPQPLMPPASDLSVQKLKANGLINSRVRCGVLVPPDDCVRCGRVVRLVAHHDDYYKPDVVEWLCYSCHKQHHADAARCIKERTMKWLETVRTDHVELEIFECGCGFHFGLDTTYLEQVGPIRITCPSCGISLDTSPYCEDELSD